MTSPAGWSLGDAPQPDDDPYGDWFTPQRHGRHRRTIDGRAVSAAERHDAAVRRESAKREADAEVVRAAVPSILDGILSSMLECVRLCRDCRHLHFGPSPDLFMRTCNRVECECWCTTLGRT